MLNIQPIRLLKGCHPSTGDTGSGCFLNVCSYLQGDKIITDEPSSVDDALRYPLLALNDGLDDVARQALLPFVHRAMLTGGHHFDAYSALMEMRDLATALCLLAEIKNMPHDLSLFNSTLEFGAKISNVITAVLSDMRKRWHKPVIVYSELTVSDYVLGGTPLPPTQWYREVQLKDRAVEVIVEHLDRALPSDVEPRPIVAARAALLVETKKEWGNKPLPKGRGNPEVKDSFYPGFGGLLDIKSAQFEALMASIDADFAAGPDKTAMGVAGKNPSHFFYDKYDYAFAFAPKPAPAPKKNTPHGPLKLHKPLFI